MAKMILSMQNKLDIKFFGDEIIPLLNNFCIGSTARKEMLAKGETLDTLAQVLFLKHSSAISVQNIFIFVQTLLDRSPKNVGRLIQQYRSAKQNSVLQYYLERFVSIHDYGKDEISPKSALQFFVHQKEHRAFLSKHGVLKHICGSIRVYLKKKNYDPLDHILGFLLLFSQYPDGQQLLLQIEGVLDDLSELLKSASVLIEKTILLSILLVQTRENKIVLLSNGRLH
jgi:hypothetical protein